MKAARRWQCPRCRKIMADNVARCGRCGRLATEDGGTECIPNGAGSVRNLTDGLRGDERGTVCPAQNRL